MANAQTTQNSNEYEQCGNPFIIPEDKTNRNLPLTINLYRTCLPTIHSNLRRQCSQYRTSIEVPNHSTKKNTWKFLLHGSMNNTAVNVSPPFAHRQRTRKPIITPNHTDASYCKLKIFRCSDLKILLQPIRNTIDSLN